MAGEVAEGIGVGHAVLIPPVQTGAPKEVVASEGSKGASSPRRTDARPRIVLVTNHADARIIPLLERELSGLGLDVVTVDKGPDEVLPDDLIRAARAGLRCMEVPVSYRRRVGVSKVTGTVAGTVKASTKILWTIARHGWER